MILYTILCILRKYGRLSLTMFHPNESVDVQCSITIIIYIYVLRHNVSKTHLRIKKKWVSAC